MSSAGALFGVTGLVLVSAESGSVLMGILAGIAGVLFGSWMEFQEE